MRSFLLLVLGILLFAGCTTVNVRPDDTADEPTAPAAEAPSSAPDDEATEGDDGDDDPFASWDDTLEDTREMDGFLPLHEKDDGTLYAEISSERMGTPFGLTLHISQGVGVFNLHDGLPLSDTRLMQFRRVNETVHLVHRNVRFRADTGPMRTSLEDNTAHSVVETFDIVSRNDSTGHLLIEVSDFLVSDYPEIGDRLKLYFGGAPATFQRDKSHVTKARGFPENTEIDVSLTYQGSSAPLIGGEAVPDYRAVPVGVRYSLFELPETRMQRRRADDRVGYFVDAVKDFSRDPATDPHVRYVQRWRLAPSDTAAYKRGERVEPAEPIVYYVDRTVPERYRKYVRQGIEAWNEAYRAAGYKNAVEARMAPDDSTWSAEDIRYSTVQWTAAHQMGYAIGPSQTDPRTGEILNADVLISSSLVRGWQDTYSQVTPGPEAETKTVPHGPVSSHTPEALREMLSPELARRACWAERGMAQQINLQRTLLLARGTIASGESMPTDYLGAAIKDLVMHEVGHTLGLRHNFKASSGIPRDELHDESYTDEHGVSLSVMDYAPVNVALNEEKQGHYWNPTVGPYDEWAIQYGYMPIADQSEDGPLTRDAPLADTMADEVAGLSKIAAESSDSMHRYGTDEDNWLGGYAVDPLTNAWELGNDPKAFAATRADLVRQVMPTLEDRLVSEGERYHPLRRATTALLMERYRSLLPVTKTVGGSYVARDHKGTPDARPPLRPVSAEEQRAAVQLLVEEAFAPDAFQFDPDRLNKLAPNRRSHWGTSPSLPVDYPVHRRVHTIQRSLLRELFHPARLQRMIDAQARTPDGAGYTPGPLFQTMTDAIWSELGTDGVPPAPINSFRRPLQRTYADVLIELMMGTTSWITITTAGIDQIDAPEDVRSMARLELTELSSQLDAALEAPDLETETRAHLAETQARIDRALNASLTLSP
ncbi:zinc-dependent metalloprotease [Salinibacter altiplanensis]|uniref:zinc-dependent metalloprotease n=1 Tax=Salinibacter altiplanensis TaxID=1803181 RepID=UPI000C9EDDCF|nr:zinc-dependent metalloprotease [Salinibacter altiplanensis]